MSSDRWTRTEQLFHDALALAAAERLPFLKRACAGDEDMRRDVESLLASAESDDGFLSANPWAPRLREISDPGLAMSGRALGAYRLEQLLGHGGMGEVYRARDTRLDRVVAIKILPTIFMTDAGRLARFEREARLLAALNHPNICGIHGVEEADSIRFIILEFVDGETLAERIARQAALSVDEALTLARQVTAALEAAHDRGIVHRDLKPANIIITSGGVVKVLDFGLAKTIRGEEGEEGSASSTLGLSREGGVVGTAAYMSPEQARGLTVDKRTDIWAFGCVLYEMLTGRAPFAGATVSDSIARTLEREPDWSALPGDTPPAIGRLLLRCLTKDPKQRLRDIGDARIEIDAATRVLPAGELTTPPPRGRSRAAILPWAIVIALATALVVLVVQRPRTIADPLAGAQFSALTDWDGSEALGEISPDGRFVAFLAERSGERDIWWSQLGTGDFRNLTTDLPPLNVPGLMRTFGFSGDGAQIWLNGTTQPNVVMPQTGGVTRRFLAADAKALAWSTDGSRIAYFMLSGDRDPLFIADRTGADARPVEIKPSDPGAWHGVADSRIHNHNPIWSPDDRWIYFVHGAIRDWNHSSDDMDIWRVPAMGGSPERLTQIESAVTFLAVIDDRTLLYIAPAEDGSGSWLWSFNVTTRTRHRAVSGLEQFTSVSASRNGRRVVATRARPASGLWVVPITERGSDNSATRPYPGGAAQAMAPRFGGGTLFYLTARGTGDALCRLDATRCAVIQQGSDGMVLQAPAPSPDGQLVAVVRKNAGGHLLTVVTANGAESRTVAASLDAYGSADWSPDGKWLVTGGVDASGRPGLFKIPIDERDAAPVRIADGEAINPVWSPKGDLIVYAGPFVKGQSPLFAVRPDRTAVNLPPLRVSPGGYRFLRDGSGLVYLPRPESQDFWTTDIRSGQTRQLTRLGYHGIIRRFDLTPDGKEIVFDRTLQNSDIVLIDLPPK